MLETISEHRSFEGVQGFYRHQSEVIGLPMRFSVYRPPQVADRRVPVLFYLAGLTCSEETFTIKAGAQRMAAKLGLMLVACDTSPRNTGIPGEADDWEFGTGAGFYLNATQPPWSKYFRMYDYVLGELREAVLKNFPGSPEQLGIFGHSMGGHGALVLALRNPSVYHSVSAFAPICSPTRCPWGQKALPRYLGEDRASWAQLRCRRADRGARLTGVSTDPGRSGHGGQIPVPGTAAAGAARAGVREGAPAAAAATSGRLRSRLLLHSELHGRSSALSC